MGSSLDATIVFGISLADPEYGESIADWVREALDLDEDGNSFDLDDLQLKRLAPGLVNPWDDCPERTGNSYARPGTEEWRLNQVYESWKKSREADFTAYYAARRDALANVKLDTKYFGSDEFRLPCLILGGDEFKVGSYYSAEPFDPSSLRPAFVLTALFKAACRNELGLILGDDHPSPSWLLLASYG